MWTGIVRTVSNDRAATRYRKSIGRRAGFESLEARRVLDSTVVFNEIMYHPVEGDTLEFVELYNQMGVDMDISGWRVAGGVDFEFAPGTIIESDSYLVLGADPGALALINVTADGQYTGRLANNGDTLRLLDRNDRQLDRVEYDDAGNWPIEADGSGASLAKRLRQSTSGPAEHWVSSIVQGGTPGRANFADQQLTVPEPRVQTLVTLDADWQYESSGESPPSDWATLDFDGASWQSAAGVFYAGNAYRSDSSTQVVANVNASASSELAGFNASQLVDGSGLDGDAHTQEDAVATMWQSTGTFFGLPPDTDPEVTFDLGSEQTVNAIRVWNYNSVDGGNCCLDRGIALADVLIAGDDGQFTPLIVGQAFAQAPGTATDFSQTIDLGGVDARYVKIDVDTSNGVANHGDVFSFVGLSEVQFLTRPLAGTSELPLGANTYYFRHEFNFDDDGGRTTLDVTTLIDDGAAVYLNGVEIDRRNLADGPLTPDTSALSAVGDVDEERVVLPGDALVTGRNVLAVEVHQSSAPDDNDMVFGLEMTATTQPASFDESSLPSLSINELGIDGDTAFVELFNDGLTDVDLSPYEFLLSRGGTQLITQRSLGAGERLSIAIDRNAWGLEDGDRIYLVDRVARKVVSAVRYDESDVNLGAIARWPEGSGTLQVTVSPTPGAANQVVVEDAIVINEVMYHHRPTVANPEKPPTLTALGELVSLGSVWRFNESGEALPSDWPASPHAVGGNWQEGGGLLGFETAELPAPGIVTQFEPPSSNRIIAYYAETDFELTAEELAETDALSLQHVVDDGAVFFINGVEVHRFNMDEGELDPTQTASRSVVNAAPSEPVALPVDLLRAGTNRLSIQLHQRNASSSDVVLGARLTRSRIAEPGTEATPYQVNDEEWIELYNRSDRSIDLSGWQLDDAIEWTMPAETVLGPQEFLVVANDAAQLAEKYPEIAERIVGDFSGSLSNKTERIQLLDGLGNVADEVRYVEGGQWPDAADGGGSSLELRDPWADNSNALAWAASDESHDSPWKTYQYQGFAKRSTVGPDGAWEEFLIGMLSDGEILLDDISVIEDPSGDARELIQNGSFEADTIGESADRWRLIGNHRHSKVVADPDDPANKALHFVATGATEHMHNHGETTLKHGDEFVDISTGGEYKISFRAKWITGGNLLNSRLYFNRLPRTTPIAQPLRHGTPGAENSAWMDGLNIGPTYASARHEPVVPDRDQPVTVSIEADDPQGVADVRLWYAVESGAWSSVEMLLGGGEYRGTIPGQDARDVVQFYVEGTDSQGATTTWPRDGRESRALYQVQDGRTAETALRNFRMVVTSDDAEFLHSEVELMSNDRVGATIIVNESEVYYDAGIRLSGSQRARPITNRLSFSVGFNADQLFRGVHSAITIDRSESTGFGQREHLYHHGMSHAAGGLPSEYNDLFHIITPRNQHTGSAEAQLARYSDIFFDEQYENGSDGQLYEYELVYYPTQTVDRGDPESRKRPNPDSVVGHGLGGLEGTNEDFRWTYLNKNNRLEDDYSRIMEFSAAVGQSTAGFLETIHQYIDVDQWLRAFAYGHVTGHADNYSADGSQHNLQLFVRPSDNLVLQMPHDADAFFSVNRPLVNNPELRRLVRNPEYAHMYYGHVLDMIDTTFNTAYMERWTDYWQSLLPGQPFDRHLVEMQRRSDYLVGQVLRQSEQIDFDITTEDATVDSQRMVVSGNGWFNVRELRLAGSDAPLDVTWTDTTAWEAEVALQAGPQQIVVQAFDFQGRLVGTDQLNVTSSVTNPVDAYLRISELDYNPSNPSDAELELDPTLEDGDFEFVELLNTGDVNINLLGVYFSDAIDFVFPDYELAPNQTVVVARNPEALAIRFGGDVPVVGPYDGRLDNGGERISLSNAAGQVIVEFEYDDAEPWPTSADGDGDSLQLLSPATNLPSLAASWIGSTPSPGRFESQTADLNGDGLVDAADIDRLCAAVSAGDLAFDFNGDGQVDLADRDRLLAIMGTPLGDANLDGVFNSRDLVSILAIGEYEDQVEDNSGWADGDWNCDGDFDTGDFVDALARGTYSRE